MRPSASDGAGPQAPQPCPRDLGSALRWATGVLVEAGVASPRADAEWLAAHVGEQTRGQMLAAALKGAESPEGFAEAIRRRSMREPLQHIIGSAGFFGMDVAVGPGVFVPRPETESLVQLTLDVAPWLYHATAGAPGQARPLHVADWCAGSGAIALALATHFPEVLGSPVEITAIERDPAAWAFAQRNLQGTGVTLIHGDVFTRASWQEHSLDLVVTNPPYVPGAQPIQDIETQSFDPHEALYGGGADGLDVPLALLKCAGRALRPGGVLLMEHAETQGSALTNAACANGAFTRAQTFQDLTGRDRVTVFWRAPSAAEHGSAGKMKEYPQ